MRADDELVTAVERCFDELSRRRGLTLERVDPYPHRYAPTDTAAALRASEMGCNALIKATKVDGVYSADPVKNPNAVRYEKLLFKQVLANDLKVMDAPAIALARENNIPILVCSIFTDGMLSEVLQGRGHYTLIHN